MARDFLRFLPKDSRTTVASGWCFTDPTQVPAECSWCGKEFEVVETASNHAYAWCGLCDEPAAPRPWGEDPADAYEMDDEGGGE